MLEWPWFDDTEERLRKHGRELSTSLARDALHSENYQRALDLAAELVSDDPLDETAAELAIRACLLAGNRAAAILEYRRYASALRVELDSNPSSDLRALVSAL
jgi:DNA-binding SARP family transcriptional activator